MTSSYHSEFSALSLSEFWHVIFYHVIKRHSLDDETPVVGIVRISESGMSLLELRRSNSGISALISNENVRRSTGKDSIPWDTNQHRQGPEAEIRTEA